MRSFGTDEYHQVVALSNGGPPGILYELYVCKRSKGRYI